MTDRSTGAATPTVEAYKPENHVRIVTAASLFDGHDAAINIMRRILQASGAEVIHLGHNRSVKEVVDCAIQLGVYPEQSIAQRGDDAARSSHPADLRVERVELEPVQRLGDDDQIDRAVLDGHVLRTGDLEPDDRMGAGVPDLV